MPTLINPDLPPEVETAVGVIGSRAQADILRQLSLLGPSTAGELVGATGISRPSLNRHLVALQRSGIVIANPPGNRAGKTLRYSARMDRVRDLADKYVRYVSGD